MTSVFFEGNRGHRLVDRALECLHYTRSEKEFPSPLCALSKEALLVGEAMRRSGR